MPVTSDSASSPAATAIFPASAARRSTPGGNPSTGPNPVPAAQAKAADAALARGDAGPLAGILGYEEKPLVSAAVAAVAGIIAVRNPQMVSSLIAAFFEDSEPKD